MGRFGLGKEQTALRLWNGPVQFSGGFDPLGDYDFDVCQCLGSSGPISGTPRQLGHFSYKRLIFVAPVKDDLVFGQSPSTASLY